MPIETEGYPLYLTDLTHLTLVAATGSMPVSAVRSVRWTTPHESKGDDAVTIPKSPAGTWTTTDDPVCSRCHSKGYPQERHGPTLDLFTVQGRPEFLCLGCLALLRSGDIPLERIAPDPQ
jgi:hypothetical protein